MNSNGNSGSDERTVPKEALDQAPVDAGRSAEPAELDVRLDATAQALIGQQLRAIYDEIRQQEVPDHLLRLLDELERKERQA